MATSTPIEVAGKDAPAARRAIAGTWGRRGFFAIADQALIAGSNFMLNIILARYLPHSDYGAFSVGFAVFLLLGTIHSALWTEPMMVYGSGKYQQRFTEYAALLLRAHWYFVAVGSFLFASLGAWFMQRQLQAMASAFFGLALCLPFVLFSWFARRACYVNHDSRLAATGGLCYLVTLLAGLGTLHALGWLSVITACAILALAGLVSGGWLTLHSLGKHDRSLRASMSRDVTRDHLSFGRWSLIAAALYWVPGNAYFLFLSSGEGGLEASAKLRALMNLVMPAAQMSSALGLLLVPVFVRAIPIGRLPRLLRISVLLFGAGAAAYCLVLGLLHRHLVNLLYAGRYQLTSAEVLIVGLLPIVSSMGMVLGSAWRALNQPSRLCWAYGAATLITVTAGLAMTRTWGLSGAATGMVVSFAVVVLISGSLLWSSVDGGFGKLKKGRVR